MIVVNRNWLLCIGMPPDVVASLEETSGLMLSDLDTFATGITGVRYTSALAHEMQPRTLLLVGMTDRNGHGAGSSTIEIGISGGVLHRPSETERDTMLDLLSLVDHWTARAIEAALSEATCA